jgi:hypothetical protein
VVFLIVLREAGYPVYFANASSKLKWDDGSVIVSPAQRRDDFNADPPLLVSVLWIMKSITELSPLRMNKSTFFFSPALPRQRWYACFSLLIFHYGSHWITLEAISMLTPSVPAVTRHRASGIAAIKLSRSCMLCFYCPMVSISVRARKGT